MIRWPGFLHSLHVLLEELRILAGEVPPSFCAHQRPAGPRTFSNRNHERFVSSETVTQQLKGTISLDLRR